MRRKFIFKEILKKIFLTFRLDPDKLIQRLNKWSIRAALSENGLSGLAERLRKIVPDISGQESTQGGLNDCSEIKRRLLQAFQCSLMFKAIEYLSPGNLTVVDIGDSAGTHMLYLKELAKDKFNINSISVNLDPRAIEKIKARGLMAILCRAEDLDLGAREVDLLISFEMVEHLHNPAVFFRRLAKKSTCNKLVITVPYMKRSRVGLSHIRNGSKKTIFAEEEHIFELSPEDWALLMLHSGWRVTYGKSYYQYPRKWPVISQILAAYWRKTDFEGFWGAILEKDTTFSDCYQDWQDYV